jgi:hypothetical protein
MAAAEERRVSLCCRQVFDLRSRLVGLLCAGGVGPMKTRQGVFSSAPLFQGARKEAASVTHTQAGTCAEREVVRQQGRQAEVVPLPACHWRQGARTARARAGSEDRINGWRDRGRPFVPTLGITKRERAKSAAGKQRLVASGRVWSQASPSHPSESFVGRASADPDDARGDEDGAQGEAGR